jgi:hypothetical protein
MAYSALRSALLTEQVLAAEEQHMGSLAAAMQALGY